MNEEAHAAAVKAALNAQLAALPGPPRAYDYDERKALPVEPATYMQITVTAIPGDRGRLCGDVPVDRWRITTQYVDKVGITNVRRLRARAFTALRGIVLTIDGKTTTPIRYETGNGAGQDDEFWWVADDSWTYGY